MYIGKRIGRFGYGARVGWLFAGLVMLMDFFLTNVFRAVSKREKQRSTNQTCEYDAAEEEASRRWFLQNGLNPPQQQFRRGYNDATKKYLRRTSLL